MPKALKRNIVTGQKPFKNLLSLHYTPKIVLSMNGNIYDVQYLSSACLII